MAFADEVVKDGRELIWALDVSTDNFATTLYRWATRSFLLGANWYEERLCRLGNIKRGFAADHLPAASSFSASVDNTDFVADFLVTQATVETVTFKARFRLYCGVTDSAGAVVTQLIGTFVLLDFPTRDSSVVKLSLADDSMGLLADLLVPPNFADWEGIATPATEVFVGQGVENIDTQAPFPLQFGPPPYIGFPLGHYGSPILGTSFDGTAFVSSGGVGLPRRTLFPVVVCATRDSATITADDVSGPVYCVFGQQTNRPDLAGFKVWLPETFPNPKGAAGSIHLRMWKAYKSDTITKNGYAWKILWLAFSLDAYVAWMTSSAWALQNVPWTPSGALDLGRAYPLAADYPVPLTSAAGVPTGSWGQKWCSAVFRAIDYFELAGKPGSQLTGKANPGHPIDIMQDLVEHYSALGSSAVDTTRFARCRKATTKLAKGMVAAGDTRGTAARGGQALNTQNLSAFGLGTLRSTIRDLASSHDFDVFMTTSGQVGLVSQFADFETQTGTFPSVDEEKQAGVSDRIPSVGERWSPYNRVFIEAPDGGQLGPYDNAAAITSWGRVIAKVVGGKWWASLFDSVLVAGLTSSPMWQGRNLESKARPIISFVTDVSILAVDLGEYFTMSWTRGGANAAYSSSLWRIESMVISPSIGRVSVEAVWFADLQTDQPYLLDNETLVVRATPAHSLTVTDGSSTITRAGGSFITDAVAAGDIIRLRDTTETAATPDTEAFTRNRDVRVASVTDALNLVIVVGDTDFGTAGAHVIAAADWLMLRGATTYPSVITDAANYPSGSAFFGKISSGGVYSNAAAANKLLDG